MLDRSMLGDETTLPASSNVGPPRLQRPAIDQRRDQPDRVVDPSRAASTRHLYRLSNISSRLTKATAVRFDRFEATEHIFRP